MDDGTLYVIAGGVVLLLVVAAFAARRRRSRAVEPVRLGPSWSPQVGANARKRGGDVGALLKDDPRVEALTARTGQDERTVATVVLAWDEFNAVLGERSLADHQFRIYDPYDPPVVGRRADMRPVVDPARVARDIERRTAVAETDARLVLDALIETGDLDVTDADVASNA